MQLSCFVLPAQAAQQDWEELDTGLGLKISSFRNNPSGIIILRIDPTVYDFILCSAAEQKNMPYSLSQWAKIKNLDAAINASMYLTDGLTSTGYLRQGSYINNGRISKKFGAFFAANANKPALPSAVLLERETPNLQETLANYGLVIQNYRLTNSAGKIMWPAAGPEHRTAAVGIDGQGRILFLFCAVPVPVHALAQELLKLPIDLRTSMYVEGGSQAGLYIRAQHGQIENTVTSLFTLFGLTHEPLLPNVLGIRKNGKKNE